MNYEKKYKEALERAKELLKVGLKDTKDKRVILSFFPELAESEDEKIRKHIIEVFKDNFSGEDSDRCIAWLEKQGEQKSAMSKIKVGDYVVIDGEVLHVKEVTEDGYLTDEGGLIPFRNEKEARLWTIQDAKDGDAVVDKSDGAIGIFQSIGHHPDGGSYNDPSYCFLHCHCDDEFFYADFEHGNEIDSDDLVPATKEQRDLLFSKMKEAGYEWDAENKELKKIEQKPIKVPKFKVGDFIQFNGMGHTRYTVKEVCGLSHYINTCNKRMDMSYTDANFELVEQKHTEWSKEDERIKNNLLSELTNLSVRKLIEKETENKYVNWLKSIRPQSTWKPSEEMLEALYRAIPENTMAISEDEMLLDKLYQGLKYGKVLSNK